MSRRLAPIIAILSCLFVSSVWAAEPTAESKLLMTERGKLLFSDDFSQPLDKRWRTGVGDWQVKDGELVGAERAADMHGAVARHAMPFKNVVIEYSFKFDGAKTTTLSINDAKEHVCRVRISPAAFIVQKDDHDHQGPDKAVVFGTQKVKLEPGQWHTVTVEILGNEMLGRLDSGLAIFGEHELIGTDKANLGFTVTGQSVAFRNLRVWEALPNQTWADTKAKLTAAK